MIKLSIPNLSGFNELLIEEKENSIIVKSQDFGKTSFVQRALINEIGRKYGIDCTSCFSVNIPKEKFDFNSLKEAVEKVEKAVKKYRKELERSEVLSIRVPSHLKDELNELSKKYQISIAKIIEALIEEHRDELIEYGIPSFALTPRREISEKEEIQKIFKRIDNLKPGNEILERLSKAIKEKFKDCVLVASKIYENSYYDLVGFFERPRVNFYFNLTTQFQPNVSVIRERDKKWDEIKRKAKKYGIESREFYTSNLVSLFIEAKDENEAVKAVEKFLKFFKKEKISWGWWYKKY
jgi:predicted DNA-binding protein